MPINKESTPPPIIGKAGRYTVFLTPPSTPKPPKSHFDYSSSTKSESPLKIVTPPVQPPPQQLDKSTKSPSPPQFQKSSKSNLSDSTKFGFFWNAVAKVQNAHSSLDGYLAEWFGLDHSKYQWALDDYYETKGMVKGDMKPKESASKGQSV
ncbi:hypothetical protein ACHQM5_030118 [Ranunculus cassubicifolius]